MRTRRGRFVSRAITTPPLCREYVHTCPQDFKAVEIVSMLPVVGTFCTEARAEYLDGVEQSPSFLTVPTARAAN